MKFYNWLTLWDGAKNGNKSWRKMSAREFHNTKLPIILKSSSVMKKREEYVLTQSEAEAEWEEAGKPYYNVHPFLVPCLEKTDLSKVPYHLLETPRNLKMVNVRFCQKHEELSFSYDRENRYITSVLFGRLNGLMWVLLIDTNVKTGGSFRSSNPIIIRLRDSEDEDATIEDYINHLSGDSQIWNDFHKEEIVSSIMKIVVTIGFLANSNDELIEYDVLAKDREAYRKATDKLFFQQKARKKGKFGWNVGNDILFLGEHDPKCGASSSQGNRELNLAHIRCGHPHAVRYGKGKKKVKIMWFRPTVVRPDLPFNSVVQEE